MSKIKAKLAGYFEEKAPEPDPDRFSDLYPKCLDGNMLHMIGSDYRYYPCCFTRVGFGKKEFDERFGDKLDQIDIRLNSREEIVNSPLWHELIESFETKPMKTCYEFCEKKFKPNSQFDGRNGFRVVGAKKSSGSF